MAMTKTVERIILALVASMALLGILMVGSAISIPPHPVRLFADAHYLVTTTIFDPTGRDGTTAITFWGPFTEAECAAWRTFMIETEAEKVQAGLLRIGECVKPGDPRFPLSTHPGMAT
jgi:hypothetical protein